MTFLQVCKKVLFLFLSILTLGVIFGLFLAALILGQQIELFEKDKTLLAIVITVMAVSFLLLAFAIYVSFANKRIFQIVLGILCIILSFCFLAVGIAAIISKNEIIPTLEKVWSGTSTTDQDIVTILQNAFECCGWNSTTGNCNKTWTQPCVEVIKPDVDKYWNGISGGVIGFGGVVAVLAIVTTVITCRQRSDSVDKGSEEIPQFNEYLNSGTHGGTSRGTYKYTW
jgi:hypothetical protein